MMILGVEQLHLSERKSHNSFVGDKRNVEFYKRKTRSKAQGNKCFHVTILLSEGTGWS